MFYVKGYRFGLPLVERIGFLKHLGTYPVTWNRHAGMEIHFVLKGDISWELRGQKKPLSVPGGSFGIIPAGMRHRAYGDKGTPAVRIGLILEKAAPTSTDGTFFSSADLRRILQRFNENGGRVRRMSARLSAILHDLAAVLNGVPALTVDEQMRLRALTGNLLYEMYVALGEPEALAKGLDVVPKIRSWIDAHCAERITIPELVRLSGYGRSRFFALFLADTGMTPNDYLVRARIERAKRALAKETWTDSMLDLAVACGFNSSSVFSTTFRKHVGLSPREFRAAALHIAAARALPNSEHLTSVAPSIWRAKS